MHTVIGIKANPWAIFVESVSSPIIVFMTPTLPFSTPHKQRLEDHVKVVWLSFSWRHTWRQGSRSLSRGRNITSKYKNPIAQLLAPACAQCGQTSDSISALSMPARRKTAIPVNRSQEIILASDDISTYNDSSIVSYSGIITSSDIKFCNKLSREVMLKLDVTVRYRLWSHTWLIYGNIDMEAMGSTSCNTISIPIWSFGRGVLCSFEAAGGTKGVVSLAMRGQFEVSIGKSELKELCNSKGWDSESALVGISDNCGGAIDHLIICITNRSGGCARLAPIPDSDGTIANKLLCTPWRQHGTPLISSQDKQSTKKSNNFNLLLHTLESYTILSMSGGKGAFFGRRLTDCLIYIYSLPLAFECQHEGGLSILSTWQQLHVLHHHLIDTRPIGIAGGLMSYAVWYMISKTITSFLTWAHKYILKALRWLTYEASEPSLWAEEKINWVHRVNQGRKFALVVSREQDKISVHINLRSILLTKV